MACEAVRQGQQAQRDCSQPRAAWMVKTAGHPGAECMRAPAIEVGLAHAMEERHVVEASAHRRLRTPLPTWWKGAAESAGSVAAHVTAASPAFGSEGQV